MKHLIITSLLLIFATSAHAHLSKVHDNDSINIIIIDPDNEPPNPHLSPIHQDVYGVYSQTNHSLSVFVSQDIAIIRVRIYSNNTLVVDDDNPIMLYGILYYNMSSFNSGAYSIVLDADDGTVYIGTFTL